MIKKILTLTVILLIAWIAFSETSAKQEILEIKKKIHELKNQVRNTYEDAKEKSVKKERRIQSGKEDTVAAQKGEEEKVHIVRDNAPDGYYLSGIETKLSSGEDLKVGEREKDAMGILNNIKNGGSKEKGWLTSGELKEVQSILNQARSYLRRLPIIPDSSKKIPTKTSIGNSGVKMVAIKKK